MSTQWEISDGSRQQGPLEEAAILAAIAQGLSPAVQARPVGAPSFEPLDRYPAFAAALASRTPAAPAAAPPRRATSRWLIAAAVAAMLTPVAVLASHLLLRAEAGARFVSGRDLPHECHASNAEVACAVTNASSSSAVTTCFRGKLAQKEANGVALSSLILCTGRIAPRETKSVSAPWTGGFARDVCSSKSALGGEMLDWDKCAFSTEPVEPWELDRAAAKSGG